MTICPKGHENIGDTLEVKGMNISGDNIVTKTLEWARANNFDVPPLRIELDKKFPMGSGIGAGSGNAAALIAWLRGNCSLNIDNSMISQLGADVSFLAGSCGVALAEGIGDRLTPLEDILGLTWLIAFPAWASSTAMAYAKLDRQRLSGGLDYSYTSLEFETKEILAKLKNKEHIGLLPNDFLPILAGEHTEYAAAFEIAEGEGAIAWGLCGSGSALFAICENTSVADKIESLYEQEEWIIKITKLE